MHVLSDKETETLRDPTRIGRQTEIVKVLALDDVELHSGASEESNPLTIEMQSNFRQQLIPVRVTQDLGCDLEIFASKNRIEYVVGCDILLIQDNREVASQNMILGQLRLGKSQAPYIGGLKQHDMVFDPGVEEERGAWEEADKSFIRNECCAVGDGSVDSELFVYPSTLLDKGIPDENGQGLSGKMGRSAAFQLILDVTKIKRSATIKQEVEVTRDGTSTEVDSQLGIQAQLKHEIDINTE